MFATPHDRCSPAVTTPLMPRKTRTSCRQQPPCPRPHRPVHRLPILVHGRQPHATANIRMFCPPLTTYLHTPHSFSPRRPPIPFDSKLFRVLWFGASVLPSVVSSRVP